MEPHALFRKAALDEFTSPERLDVPMTVVSSIGWVALCALGAVLVAIVSWSVFGVVPERVEGQGILIRGGALRSIAAPGSGQLSRLNVRINDIVKPGDVIGEIEQADVADRVRLAQRRYEETQLEAQKANAADQETIEGYKATIKSYEGDVARTEVILRSQADSLERLQRLLLGGGVTQSRVDQVRIEMNESQSKIDRLGSSSRSVTAQIRSADERARAREQQVLAARLNLETERHKLRATANITAAVEGRVIELKKRAGDRLGDAEVLAVVEPSDALLEPVVFVPSASGKRIESGMEVRVYPSTVKREEYGFMRGVVKTMKDFPVTPESLESIVNNSQLVSEFLASGSKIEMRVALEPDGKTRSGYAWSFGGGPPFKVDGGTTVGVAIVVARHSPISRVWPAFKEAVGTP